MKLTIVSPTEKKELNVMSIEANSTTGNFIIESGHAPLIARLDPGKELNFTRDDGTIEQIIVTDGVLKVQNDVITIILTQ